ncbi:hypothetical protein ANCCAN_18556 [Ancylostoma caninum]|uniref:Uncharacterized protein n=1 Tax=Ancylostoma caninum TaxID=29170 RepID=A0A368FX69_ANCCA|nr:hypothetical protein ANCCAN_18556 [Ancylostoma caninum]
MQWHVTEAAAYHISNIAYAFEITYRDFSVSESARRYRGIFVMAGLLWWTLKAVVGRECCAKMDMNGRSLQEAAGIFASTRMASFPEWIVQE